jgi:type II secretory pathway pseudopilin PulG
MRPLVPRRAGGFTLIEALAAIGVLMIVIPVLLQGFTLAGGIAQATRQTADATALAQSQLDEIVATNDWQYGTTSGEALIGPTRYQWVTELDQYETEVNVQTLTITVSWVRRTSLNQVMLTTVVYLPQSTVTSSTPGMTLGGGVP